MVNFCLIPIFSLNLFRVYFIISQTSGSGLCWGIAGPCLFAKVVACCGKIAGPAWGLALAADWGRATFFQDVPRGWNCKTSPKPVGVFDFSFDFILCEMKSYIGCFGLFSNMEAWILLVTLFPSLHWESSIAPWTAFLYAKKEASIPHMFKGGYIIYIYTHNTYTYASIYVGFRTS